MIRSNFKIVSLRSVLKRICYIDLLIHVMNSGIDSIYFHVVYSKLRVAELTGRKEAGLTTSALQNSRQKLQHPVHMMPKN